MAPRVVAPLVAALRDESPQLRSAAAQSLGRILADDAVEPLCVAMRDPDINLRTEAARALGRIGDRRATGVLVTEVGNPSGARCEAARALAGLADPTAREGLRWAAESCLEDVRALAMETLGTLGDTGATPLLEAAVASPRPIVRIAAIRALGRLGRKPDPQPLVALAVDTDYWVSTSARAALEELRDPRAVPGLLDVLARAPFASGPLVTTLCRLGDPRALPAVLDLLTREDAEEQDERGYVRDLVAQGLGGFGAAAVEPVVALLRSRADSYVADAAAHLPREATAPLLALLDDGSATPESRAAAARALGAIGSPTAVGPLIKALRDEDLQVRSSAAAALGLLKAAEAEEPLIEALKDPQWPLHRDAAEALGELRSQKAVPQLLNVLADTTNIACTGAARALGEIGDRRAVPGLIAALAADPPDGNLHLSALIALGEIADPSASRTLVENLGQAAARDVAHRVAAGISDPAVIPDLLKLLDTGRSVAAAALARMDDPRARSRLEAAYARREWATLCSAARFFIEQGTPGSEDVLVEALNRCGFDDMANDFFGSGNPRLRRAALCRSRYYSNVAPPVASPSGPRWGTHER